MFHSRDFVGGVQLFCRGVQLFLVGGVQLFLVGGYNFFL